MPLGPEVSLYLLVLSWVARMVVISLICTFLGWLGIRILDALTPRIHQREKIGEDPVSIGLFIAGFIIFVGLIIHGSSTAPLIIGTPLMRSLVDFRRLALMTVGFLVSLFLGIVLFNILNWVTPKIPFLKIKDSSLAIGIYVFGYLIFLGIILHAALTMSL